MKTQQEAALVLLQNGWTTEEINLLFNRRQSYPIPPWSPDRQQTARTSISEASNISFSIRRTGQR